MISLTKTSPARRRWQALGLLLGSLALGATALAVPIRGRVRLPDPPPQEDETQHQFYWRVWNGVVDPRPVQADPPRQLAVVLVGGALDEPVGCEHFLRGGDLYPRTMVVRPDTALNIENRDGCAHELMSDDVPDFAPLATSPGNTRAITIPAGGPYHIADRLYSHVQGVVHTEAGLAACAKVGDDGSFVFEGIPAGEYELRILDGTTTRHTAPVVVVEGEPVTIDPIALEAEAG